MNKKVITLFIILLSIIFISTATTVVFAIENYAANRLLDRLALAKPGVRLSEISQKLGTQMREHNKLDEVVSWGSIKDESFCKDKKLYWFYASTPPCRALEVYTDMNDRIVYVTWSGL